MQLTVGRCSGAQAAAKALVANTPKGCLGLVAAAPAIGVDTGTVVARVVAATAAAAAAAVLMFGWLSNAYCRSQM